MSLYSYQKKGSLQSRSLEELDTLYLTSQNEAVKDINIWSTAGDSYGFLQDIVNKTRWTNIVIPLMLVVLGFSFLLKHIYPTIKTKIEESNGLVAQGTISPVSDNYIDISKYISNPAGLDLISQEAFNQHVLQVDTVSQNYQGTFYISIPSLGMDRLPVKANVDSTSEEAYMSVLDSSLAHFKNTGLPISDVKNNIVVYGHSASPNYNSQPSDPMVAFSFLPNLKVGDDIFIEIEGQQYQFKMQRSKIVDPSDTSIITGTAGRRTLTLFTCYPIGNNSQRYVAIAREV